MLPCHLPLARTHERSPDACCCAAALPPLQVLEKFSLSADALTSTFDDNIIRTPALLVQARSIGGDCAGLGSDLQERDALLGCLNERLAAFRATLLAAVSADEAQQAGRTMQDTGWAWPGVAGAVF